MSMLLIAYNSIKPKLISDYKFEHNNLTVIIVY
jgi:hypothetical protein